MHIYVCIYAETQKVMAWLVSLEFRKAGRDCGKSVGFFLAVTKRHHLSALSGKVVHSDLGFRKGPSVGCLSASDLFREKGDRNGIKAAANSCRMTTPKSCL